MRWLAAVLVLLGASGLLGAEVSFRRGDVDADGVVESADVIALLDRLFGGVDVIPCDDAADSNDDGRVDVADAIFVLNFLFFGGPPLPTPFLDCGPDPTTDDLGCVASACPFTGAIYLLDTPPGVDRIHRFGMGGATPNSFTLPAPFDDGLAQLEACGDRLVVATDTGVVAVVDPLAAEIEATVDLGASIVALEESGGAVLVVTESTDAVEFRWFAPATAVIGTAVFSLDSGASITSVTVDETGRILMSGSIASDQGLFALANGEPELLLTGASGHVHYEPIEELLWWITTEAGETPRVRALDGASDVVVDLSVLGFIEPSIGDVDRVDEFFLLPFVAEGVLMSFNVLSGSPEIWLDPSDGIIAPRDVAR